MLGTISYSIDVATSDGSFQGRIQAESLSLARTANTYGVLILTTRDNRYLSRDYRYTVRRSINNSEPQIVTNTPFLLRKVKRSYQGGSWLYELTCYSALHLLARRRVIGYSDSSITNKSGPADNLLKAIATEAFSLNTWSGSRRAPFPGVAVAANQSLGPTITKEFAWRKTLEVMQEIAGDSLQQGTGLYFDIINGPDGGLLFDTFVGQRGVDRRHGYSAVKPLILSAERRNLDSIQIVDDWTEEVTAVYVGGKGEGSARAVTYLEDVSRSVLSLYNFSEDFVDARDKESTGLPAEGRSRLQEGTPVSTFSALLVPTLGTQFMQDWDFGDYATALAEGQQYNCRINTVKIDYKQGKESIEARIST